MATSLGRRQSLESWSGPLFRRPERMSYHSRFFFARFYEASGASARNQNFAYSRRNCFAPFICFPASIAAAVAIGHASHSVLRSFAMFIALVAAAPSLALLAYFYLRDRY